MPADAQASLALAERFFDAMSRGDADAAREVLAPDARIWHNVDGVYQTVDENLRLMRWMGRNVVDSEHESVRREATATGFVQQYVMRGKNRNGVPFELPACIVATVADGRITALEEYLDSAHGAVLFQ